jgi:hypothetical protein
MFLLKNGDHVRTMRHIKSFRSCPNSTGMLLAPFDRGRIALEKGKRTLRERRRLWLAAQWAGHPARSRQANGRGNRRGGGIPRENKT